MQSESSFQPLGPSSADAAGEQTPPRRVGFLGSLARWFSSGEPVAGAPSGAEMQIDWLRCLPFFALHVACFAVIWTGVSWVAVGLAAALYVVRMFLITGFYHRYFSHRTFRTSRWFQFVAAFAGCTAGQRGPLWWAAHHRHHHTHSDDELDRHSPRRHGFLYSHLGWFLTRQNFATDSRLVRDWLRFPELRYLDRYDWIPFALLGAAVWWLGALAARHKPELGTDGPQLFVWFLISTIVLYHVTYTINSLAHSWGTKRFETADDSRNNALLALLTLGEGWHNNHHYYPASVRQGFLWWEVDVSYYVLKVLSWLRLVKDLRPVPSRVRDEARRAPGSTRQKGGPR